MGTRKYPDTPRVYLDMDGPLADFDAAYKAHGLEPKHFKRVAGAYLNLPVVPGALEAVRFIETLNLQVFLLTKIPSCNPYAATEKLLWVEKHLPALADKVIISSDKGAVGTSRDFLVDDHPEWANADNFPGQVLLFTGDWDAIKAQLAASLTAALR